MSDQNQRSLWAVTSSTPFLFKLAHLADPFALNRSVFDGSDLVRFRNRTDRQFRQRLWSGALDTSLFHQPRHLRHLHLLPTAFTCSPTGIHLDTRAPHGHATGIDLYEAATGFEGDFGTRFNHGFLARFDVQFRAGLAKPGRAGFEVQGAGDVEAVVFAGLFALLAVHRVMAVAFGVAEAVVLHRQVAVVLDDFGAIVFRKQVQVFLGVHVDLFFARFVFKAQFVAALALVGFGFQGDPGFVFRQRVGRCVGGVVSPAGNNGLVRVAVQEANNHFVADSGQGHKAVLAAGPALADSEPGAAVFIIF